MNGGKKTHPKVLKGTGKKKKLSGTNQKKEETNEMKTRKIFQLGKYGGNGGEGNVYCYKGKKGL